MSRFRSLLLILGVLISFSVPTFSDSIGFLDMGRIMQSYEEAIVAQEALRKEGQALEKKLATKRTEMETAQKEGKDEESLKQLFQKLQLELQSEQEKFTRKRVDSQRRLLSKITETSKVIAKEYGIDVVLERSAVYAGGFDLTEFVVDRLNKK